MADFTSLSGEISYKGGGDKVSVSDGSYTLNGKPMENGKEYPINHGDIIKDLNFAPTGEDMKWKFK